jgi:tetratricopeptide (TPR) repeat protein
MNRRERRSAASKAGVKLTAPVAETAAALYEAGLSQMQAGRDLDAQLCCQRALALDPNHADTLHLMGLVSVRANQYDQALEWISRAIRLEPKPDYLRNLGATLLKLGRREEALKAFDKAVQLKPLDADLWSNLGNILVEVERPPDAILSFQHALKLNPRHWDAANKVAQLLYRSDRLEEALACFNLCDELQPNQFPTLQMRTLTLHRLRRFEEALTDNSRALAVRPDDAEALNNRGIILRALKRFDEALANYDRALAVRPDYAEALYNRGIALDELKRFDEALASYDRAIHARPDYVEAHWNEALLRLLTGDFSRGWAKYEWRWKNESPAKSKRNFAQPLWLGEDAIDGKTVLLYSEQGFGDTIQFCRYVPLLAARGARVMVEVPGPLQELISNLAGATQVISKGNALPDFDYQCPLLSLPLAFGTRLETIPSSTPYLQAPAQASKAWQARLGPKSRPRIGLVWSGNATHKDDHNRSIGLQFLSPLLDIGATFVSLQKDVRDADTAVLREREDIVHFGDAFKDFSDTAALISNLDLVISVDTSVAHLAGALGKPVWVLLTYLPDWRWLLDRDDSPWYPTARLFRQNDARTWDDVIARVCEALLEFIER